MKDVQIVDLENLGIVALCLGGAGVAGWDPQYIRDRPKISKSPISTPSITTIAFV